MIFKSKTIDEIKNDPNINLDSYLVRFTLDENLKYVIFCIKAGANPRYENSQALRIACRLGNLKIVKILVRNGACI